MDENVACLCAVVTRLLHPAVRTRDTQKRRFCFCQAVVVKRAQAVHLCSELHVRLAFFQCRTDRVQKSFNPSFDANQYRTVTSGPSCPSLGSAAAPPAPYAGWFLRPIAQRMPCRSLVRPSRILSVMLQFFRRFDPGGIECHAACAGMWHGPRA